MYQFNVMYLYLKQVFDNCLFNVTHSRIGHSFMYLVIYLRRKGIYHEAIYLRNWNLYTPISTDKSNFFFILDDPICMYKVASEQVSSNLCSL